MNEKADPYTRTSFGRFLQKTRLEKGIPLADVARRTRIRTQVLLAIEKEEFENLPAETFVKGLLKAFANAVGADSNEVLRLYRQSRQNISEQARFQARLKNSAAGHWLKLLCALCLLVVLAAVSIYVMTSIGAKTKPIAGIQSKRSDDVSPADGRLSDSGAPEKASSRGSGNPKAAAGEAAKQVAAKGAAQTKSEKMDPTPVVAGKVGTGSGLGIEGYLLSIHAVKDTWLKVIADEQASVKYRLKAGDRLDLTAASRFNILIGHADGVKLTLNDHPIPVNGKSGQIVNIEIP